MKRFISTASIFLLFAVPAAGQVDCTGWGSPNFFRNATAEQVTSCLEAGADPNARAPNGRTPLHEVAASSRKPDVVVALIEAGADPNARDAAGNTPLHASWSNSNPEVGATLLKLGADPMAENDRGEVADPSNCENWTTSAFQQGATQATLVACLAAGLDVDAGDEWGRTPLHRAAREGDTAIVRVLVEAGANVNAGDWEGTTPLHAAARSDSTIVRVLLNAAADIGARNDRGETPLHHASRGADPNAANETPLHEWTYRGPDSAVVALLVEAGADVNARTHSGSTPLHGASSGRGPNPGIVAMLLAAGADVNARDWKGATPVWYGSREEIVNLLLAAGADVNAVDLWGRTPLHANPNDSRRVVMLLAAGADVDAVDLMGRTPLHEAAQGGRASAIATLVAAGAGVNARDAMGNTPLHAARSNRNPQPSVMGKLLELGADSTARNQRGTVAGRDAGSREVRSVPGGVRGIDRDGVPGADSDNCNDWQNWLQETLAEETLKACLESGWDIDVRNYINETPLNYVVRMRNAGLANLLLEVGADPNVPNNAKGTPLHGASEWGDLTVVDRLLELGADPHARDRRGWTPLHVASFSRSREATVPLIATLLDAGADPNARARAGYAPTYPTASALPLLASAALPQRAASVGDTPLHLASGASDDSSRVSALLAAGADPDGLNARDETPLHRAAAARHLANVRLLLEAGADANKRDENGNTPLHLVVAYGRRSVRSTNYYVNGRNPFFRAPPQPTPPHETADTALLERDTALAVALVRAGANLGLRNSGGETPLGRARRLGSAQLADKLQELGAAPETDPAEDRLAPVCDWERFDLFAVAPPASIRGCLEAGAELTARSEAEETPLHTLVRLLGWNRSFAPGAIAALLDAGEDVDARNRAGATPLHQAVGVPAVVSALLDRGADVNAPDDRGGSALHYAAKANRPESVRMLLEAGADLEMRYEKGATPLHSATGPWGSPAVVQLLADAGADVDARDENGETPLHWAVRQVSPAVVRRLLELGADRTAVDDWGRVSDPGACRLWPTPTFFAGAKAAQVAACMEAGAEMTGMRDIGWFGTGTGRTISYPNGSTPLHVAATWTRDPAVINLLAGAGLDVRARNEEGHAPLDYAARDNTNPAVIAALVAAGARINAWSTDATPLYEAAGNANPEVAVALLEAGARMDALAKGYRTALHRAAAENANPALIAELVSRGADIHAKLPAGRTPLHEAAGKNPNPAVVVALLEAGAEVNARGTSQEVWEWNGLSDVFGYTNPWGQQWGLPPRMGNRTPLHEAVAGNANPAVVAALIEGGADIHARGDVDWMHDPAATPLYWAAALNPDATVLELLAQAGADVNARSGSGRTPLHIAALRNPVVFPKLLELGADPDALDREGKTPMDYAVENLWLQGMEEVSRLMEEKETNQGRRLG